jgi:hypothetical protein
VPGEAFIALAQWAGQTVAGAALTDVWESARTGFARLLGRGDARKAQAAEQWLAGTHEQLAAAGTSLEQVQRVLAERWADRFADLLDEDPDIEGELRALVAEVATGLPAKAVQASDNSVAAGRDLNITASGGGIAAGVIHGDVVPPGPMRPGPARS